MRCIYKGEVWDIWMTDEVAEEIRRARGQKKQEVFRIRRYLERWANTPHGQMNFLDTQIKAEGQFQTGRGDRSAVQVYAVKAYQSRIYVCRDGKGRRLLCLEADLSKKQNKADKKKLIAAARKYGDICGGREGHDA